MIDLKRLRLLSELERRGTIAAVAAALAYSPSSVSQQLAILEREAGVPLLERTGRRVRLTPAAELLVRSGREVLERMERIDAELHAEGTVARGVVRLAVFQSAALGVVPRALTILGTDYPELRVEVVQREPEQALAAVWAREFDLVVAEQYPGHTAPRPAELDRRPLVSDELRLAASDPSVLALADAAGRAWVMEPRGTASRHWAEQRCRLAGFEPDVRYETADLQAHIRLVGAGHAVAMLPDLVWGDRAPEVRTVSLDDRPRREVFTSARRSSGGSAGLAATRDALGRAVAELGLGAGPPAG